MNLPKKDYKEIMRFLDLIQFAAEDPRRKIIDALSHVFGYHKSTFWLSDHQGNLYDPVINIDERIVESYLDYYQLVDPFHPHNMKQKSRKQVINIDDLMSIRDYEQCEYFRDFMRRFNLYHEIVMFIHHEDRFIGGMAILRSANEDPFCTKDIQRLEILLKYIAKSLGSYLIYSDLQFQKNLFESFSNHSSIGLMLFDQDLRHLYSNPSAREYILDFTPRDRGSFYFESFIKNILLKRTDFRQGVRKTVFSPSSRMYTVQVLPSLNGAKNYYTAYIKPCEMQVKSTRHAVHPHSASLTQREQEVLELVFEGYTNNQIAQELVVSVHTVKTHLHNIYKKFGISSRAGLYFRYQT